MTTSNLIRWSGLAAIASGVSLVVAEFVTLRFFGYDFSTTATTGAYVLYSVLIMITGVLLPLGLVGLYARQLEASGPLGLVGFVVAFVGTVLVAGFFWTSAFIAPILAVEAPELLAVRSLPGFFRSFLVFGFGWLLFGVATLRAGVYPRSAAMLLIVGALLTVIRLPLTSVVLGAAVAWMGWYVLVTGRGTPAESPERVR
jgi:hypothetical protein